MPARTIGLTSTVNDKIRTSLDVQNRILGQTWYTDLGKACQQIDHKRTLVLAAFIAPTWCMPCRALENQVFNSSTFLEWAWGNVILCRFDFPEQPPTDPAAAPAYATITGLAAQFKVDGFPTILGIGTNTNKKIATDPNYLEQGRVVGYGFDYGAAAWIKDFAAATGLHGGKE